MKKFLSVILVFAVAFIALAILFLFVEKAFYTPSGYGEVKQADTSKAILLAGFSLLGILSKTIFDALREKDKEGDFKQLLADSLSSRNIFRSILIAPIVIISIYSHLQQITDFFFVGLIAYQNGFFFETVLQSRESKVKKDA